jgi:hypothetical protein
VGLAYRRRCPSAMTTHGRGNADSGPRVRTVPWVERNTDEDSTLGTPAQPDRTGRPGSEDDPLSVGVRLVLVSAAWCGVDRAMREILSSARLPDGVSAVAVDVDADPHTADRFSVDSIPALLWVEDGRAQFRLVGAFGRSEVDRFVRDCSSSRRDRPS